MKKVTIQEAIKANEHSRVRKIGDVVWYNTNGVKTALQNGVVYVEDIFAEWEIEEKTLELYVNVYEQTSGGHDFDGYSSKEQADKYAGNDRIRCVKMREVTDE